MNAAAEEVHFTARDGLQLFCRSYPGPTADAPTVLCLHGLTRNSRDFTALARHLQPHYRILTPDIRGRGRSAYDPHWQNYHPGTYVQDVGALLDELKIERVAIIGTSLGALMAMLLAAQQPQRLAGIALNDAGPEIDPRGLARIAQYAGRAAPVHSWSDAAAYVKTVYGDALWGLDDAQWLAYARLSYRENAEGIPVPDADPNIGAAFRDTPTAPQSLWPVYALLTQLPILVLRGEHSDILSAATVQRMAREKPDLQYISIPNRGHAPLLDEPESLQAIDGFLRGLRF